MKKLSEINLNLINCVSEEKHYFKISRLKYMA